MLVVVEPINHIRDIGIERATLLVAAAKVVGILRERAVAAADALPAGVDVDVEPDDGRVLLQQLAHPRRRHGAAAEVEQPRRSRQQLLDHLRLAAAECILAVVEQLQRDRLIALDAAEHSRGGRLAGAHEADERDVPLHSRAR